MKKNQVKLGKTTATLKPRGSQGFYAVQVRIGSARKWISSGTSILADAKPRIKAAYEVKIEEMTSPVGELDVSLGHGQVPTFREFRDAVEAQTRQVVQKRTRQANFTSLLGVSRVGAGIEGKNEDIIDQSMDLIPDGDGWDRFMISRQNRDRLLLGEPTKSELRPKEPERINTSLNSQCSHARSYLKRFRPVFAANGWKEPKKLNAFLSEFPYLSVKKSDVRYVALEDHFDVDAIIAAFDALKEEEPAMWIAFALVEQCGMRNCEVMGARKFWMKYDEEHDSYYLDIQHYTSPDPFFKPKAENSAGHVPLPEHISDWITENIEGDDDRLLKGCTCQDHLNIAIRRVNALLRSFIPPLKKELVGWEDGAERRYQREWEPLKPNPKIGREKVFYEFRKRRGSIIYQDPKLGLSYAAAFLRHDVQIYLDHYVDQKVKMNTAMIFGATKKRRKAA